MVLVILASLEATMSILTRPRPPRVDGPSDVEALEALIEEARQRARRRRRGYVACTLVAAAVGLLGFYSFNQGGGATRPLTRADVGVGSQVRDGRRPSAPGLEGGAITALAIDARDPNTLFAATLEAGVFKSSDGGRTWRALDIAPSANRVDALALVPQDPQTVYAGTGGGIFKSIDGGATWQAVNSGLFGDETAQEREHRLLEGFVFGLAVHPTNQEAVYAATWERGLLRSTDGGDSWQSAGVNGFAVTALALDPTDPETVYVGTGGRGSGAVKTTDGGASWRATGLQGMDVSSLALAPNDPKTVYAGTGDGVFKTTDGGTTWRAAGLEGNDIGGLILHPNSAAVYALSRGRIFMSTDGRTWRALNAGWAPGTWPTAFAPHPRSPGTMYVGTITAVDGKGDVGAGVFKSTDGGHSWESMNEGLTDARVSALALDPRSTGTAYAGVDGRGVFKRADEGWRPVKTGLTSEGVHAVAVDPRNPANVYAGADGGLFKSQNGGASWRRLQVPIPSRAGVSALVIDPQNPSTVYASTGDDSTSYYAGLAKIYESHVFKSMDGGLTWTTGADVQTLEVQASEGAIVVQTVHMSPLAIDPADPETLYAGGLGVLKSLDGGATWRPVGLTSTPVVTLAVDPEVPATVYAGTYAGLFKSTDAGLSWQAQHGLLDGAPVQALAIDPQRPQTVFAGTDRGVVWTGNGGHRWRHFTHLPLRTFDALAIDPAAGRVYAGAYGGGIYELKLPIDVARRSSADLDSTAGNSKAPRHLRPGRAERRENDER
jgi:photosystem II stability/assembly factor-like uncharacterized protein